RLLEIIPTPYTDPEITDFLMKYGDLYLGKTTVLCKDTPAFIANRVGVFSIMYLLHLVQKLDLTVEEVDKFSGPALGRPKSATFRTSDVVGLDTMINVANGLLQNAPNDEAKEAFILPDYVKNMQEHKWLGDKTGQGFYKKIDNLQERMRVYAKGKDKAGEFFRISFAGLFEYVSNRIPEISDELYRIDDAMRAGFGWELGPFEVWDAIGVKEGIEIIGQHEKKPAQWVNDMLSSGNGSFYKIENGIKQYYDIP